MTSRTWSEAIQRELFVIWGSDVLLLPRAYDSTLILVILRGAPPNTLRSVEVSTLVCWVLFCFVAGLPFGSAHSDLHVLRSLSLAVGKEPVCQVKRSSGRFFLKECCDLSRATGRKHDKNAKRELSSTKQAAIRVARRAPGNVTIQKVFVESTAAPNDVHRRRGYSPWQLLLTSVLAIILTWLSAVLKLWMNLQSVVSV